jgi:hypothetical protein
VVIGVAVGAATGMTNVLANAWPVPPGKLEEEPADEALVPFELEADAGG